MAHTRRDQLNHNEAEILRRTFPDISEQDLASLVNAASLRTYPAGTILCCEGCVEEMFYIIVEGQAEISKLFEGEIQRVLQRPGPGEFFGEVSLIQGCPRTATVRLSEPTTVLEVERDAFKEVLHRSAPVATCILLQVTSRLRDADQDAICDLRGKHAELKQAYVELEQALNKARNESSKNQVILESIADGVIVLDTHNTMMVVNNAVARVMGQPADQIVGRDLASLLEGVTAQTQEQMITFLESSSGQPIKFQWRDRVLSMTAARVRLPTGEEIGRVTVLRDVTDEARLERARESLFAVAAHELRTPINAIINYANMLQAGILPLPMQENAVHRITANGERLLILANNLLERAKMVAGQATLNISTFSTTELIQEIEGVMNVLALEKGLTSSTHIEDVPETLVGDRQRLYQLLVNLVGNAVKFTDEGRVYLRVYRPDTDHWALAVSDTGCGIPAEAHERIFEPFELAENPLARKHAGAGLGLFIVRQIADMMDGEITLESGIGQGSTFTVTLPLVSKA